MDKLEKLIAEREENKIAWDVAINKNASIEVLISFYRINFRLSDEIYNLEKSSEDAKNASLAASGYEILVAGDKTQRELDARETRGDY